MLKNSISILVITFFLFSCKNNSDLALRINLEHEIEFLNTEINYNEAVIKVLIEDEIIHPSGNKNYFESKKIDSISNKLLKFNANELKQNKQFLDSEIKKIKLIDSEINNFNKPFFPIDTIINLDDDIFKLNLEYYLKFKILENKKFIVKQTTLHCQIPTTMRDSIE
ncbi:hypothetical protein [Flavobacterium sp.]|uniref:hypothetical protein n=1 Tax=Flavobacterium sp. TaxID=239 RepID=UPI004047EF83